MRALYFAWVRERVGIAEEEIDPPACVKTLADLVVWLKRRGENYGAAFADQRSVRAALDRCHARPDQPIAGVEEVAFFPPMTGG